MTARALLVFLIFYACTVKKSDTATVSNEILTLETSEETSGTEEIDDTDDTDGTDDTHVEDDSDDTHENNDTDDSNIVDHDGDGISASDDCDDTDPSMPNNDADCDGFLTANDCDDTDSTINPDAQDDYVDGIDQNCDGVDGNDGGGQQTNCPGGEILDCNGNCAPADWVGDGYCDDGFGWWGGDFIYFNCAQFGNDGGDCQFIRYATIK